MAVPLHLEALDFAAHEGFAISVAAAYRATTLSSGHSVRGSVARGPVGQVEPVGRTTSPSAHQTVDVACGVGLSRTLENLVRGPVFDEPTIVKEHGHVRDAAGLSEVVGNHNE